MLSLTSFLLLSLFLLSILSLFLSSSSDQPPGLPDPDQAQSGGAVARRARLNSRHSSAGLNPGHGRCIDPTTSVQPALPQPSCLEKGRIGEKKEIMEKTETLVAGLPEDIQLQILYWLPFKTLCRLKCVCKRWQSGIFDIVRRRSTLAYMRRADQQLIFLTERGNSETGISLSLPRKSLYLITACNGMLFWGDYSDPILFYVSNPRTLEWNLIPECTKISCNVGLIFDPSVSDEHYKLVRPCNSDLLDIRFKVFSSRTGTWRLSRAKIDFDSTLYSSMEEPTFIDGILFWKAYSRFVWFDHKKKIAGIEALPGNDKVEIKRRIRFGEWDGMLTLHEITDNDIEIWILSKKSGGFQWRKKFSVNLYRVPWFDLGFNEFYHGYLDPLPYVGGELLMFTYPYHVNFRDSLFFNINTGELLKFESSKDDSEYFIYKDTHFFLLGNC